MCVHMRARVCECMNARVHVCTLYVCVHMRACVCECMNASMHVCTLCMCERVCNSKGIGCWEASVYFRALALLMPFSESTPSLKR